MCLNNIHSIISIPVLELYKIKAKQLVDSGIINMNSETCVLKVTLILLQFFEIINLNQLI